MATSPAADHGPSTIRRRPILGIVSVVVFVLGLAGYLLAVVTVRGSRFHEFKDLVGPVSPSVVMPVEPTPWQRFETGSSSRLAILLTDPQSPWLGLVHTMRSFGVPVTVTRDIDRALRHRVVLVYPMIAGSVLTRDELSRLAAFPREGGTLLATNVLGGGLEAAFGFGAVVESRRRFAVELAEGDQPLLAPYTEPVERRLPLGDATRHPTGVGTFAYLDPREPPLAVYDDGTPAIIWRSFGKGRAYAFGFDIGDYFHRGHHRRHLDANRSYVNQYEPSADVVARLVRDIYRAGEPASATLGTVPEGRDFTVIFSYDIDYSESLENSIVYAEFLRRHGIRGTFFLQTKYVRDYNDRVFFDDGAAAYIRALQELGMEVGSHSVSHARSFHDMPLGSGDESYPDYQPYVVSETIVEQGSVLGELRISRFLVEALGNGTAVESFRPGYLSYPTVLPQALEASGYRFSSSMTANNALGYLPFRLNRGRQFDQETEIFEFPIAIEDEKPPAMGSRVDAAVALARRVGGYGGMIVVLTHPNELGHKLAFHEQFVAAIRDEAWFGSHSDFGHWWAARDAIALDTTCDREVCEITVEAPIAMRGLPIALPPGCALIEEHAGTRALPAGALLAIADGTHVLRCRRGVEAPS